MKEGNDIKNEGCCSDVDDGDSGSEEHNGKVSPHEVEVDLVF